MLHAHGVVKVFATACAVAAWLIVRRRRSYLPVATSLTWLVVADAVRAMLQRFALQPARLAVGPGVPYQWPIRALFHVDQALYLSWPMAIVGAALVVYLRRRAWPAASAWLAVVASFAVAYPWLRAGLLGRANAAVFTLAALAVVCTAWQSYVVRRYPWRAAEQALGLIASGTISVTAVVLWSDDPIVNWEVARLVQTVALGLLFVYEVVHLRDRK